MYIVCIYVSRKSVKFYHPSSQALVGDSAICNFMCFVKISLLIVTYNTPSIKPHPSAPPITQALSQQDAHHALLSTYQKHWLSYQQGAKYLDNLYGYFNRVSLRKYKITEETTDYALPGILLPPVATPPPGTPVEIRNVHVLVI